MNFHGYTSIFKHIISEKTNLSKIKNVFSIKNMHIIITIEIKI